MFWWLWWMIWIQVACRANLPHVWDRCCGNVTQMKCYQSNNKTRAEDNFTNHKNYPENIHNAPSSNYYYYYPFGDCPPPVLLRQIARCCSIRTSSRLWHRDYPRLLIIHQLMALISGKHRSRVPTERASTLEVHLRSSVKWHKANKTLKDLRSWSVAEVRHTWYLLLALTVMMRHY